MMQVVWSDRLETLADRLFERLQADHATPPLSRECVVINSPSMAGWLKQYFIYERRGRGGQRVMANWEFPFLHVFVNDWLFRMTHPDGRRRDARLHPYSTDCLAWRICDLLAQPEPGGPGEYLSGYLAPDGLTPDELERRRFDLSAVLARLFDDYQIYRPDLLTAPRSKTRLPEWQARLWQRLSAQPTAEPSYLSQFMDMESRIHACGIERVYRRVSVFNVTGMPPPYMFFFQLLSALTDVCLYTFNPCREQWDEDLTAKARERRRAQRRRNTMLRGYDDRHDYLETGNPLLSSLGKGCQAYLAELLDRAGGQTGDAFSPDLPDDSVLHVIQNDIRARRLPPGGQTAGRARDLLAPEAISADGSIMIHICHTPWREVQVLHDHLLKWFSEDRDRQPRHIQVLVSNMELYAPYIDAVFAAADPQAGRSIPYMIADRAPPAADAVPAAFLQLLDLPASRFKAGAMMDLLEIEPIRAAFGLAADALPRLRNWVHAGGIRWGIDTQQNPDRIPENEPSDSGAPPDESIVSWRSGLDRLLLGYAVGRLPGSEPGAPAVLPLGELGQVAVCDMLEGSAAADLSGLLEFFENLRRFSEECAQPVPPPRWTARLHGLIDRFFAAGDKTYRHIAGLHRAVNDFDATTRVAGINRPIPVSLVRTYLRRHMTETAFSGDPARNAVVFSNLRAMRIGPRRVICLMGMNDGLFPRSDQRPGLDMTANDRRWGDRSCRLDDRHAFLEALMQVRERLYMSYVGRTDQSNERLPPSTVVSELRDYLQAAFTLPPGRVSRDGQALLYCETLHRLQAFNPAYFTGHDGLFSYSIPDRDAAARLHAPAAQPPAPASPGPTQDMIELTLDQFLRFFTNPAEYYYRNIRQVRFDDIRNSVIPDSEPFKPDALTLYNMRRLMIADCLREDHDADRLFMYLAALGLTPLGVFGRQHAERERRAILAHLDAPSPCSGLSVRQILLAAADVIAVDYTAGGLHVGGTARPVRLPDNGRALVIHRYAAIKPADLLRAWLAHLLSCYSAPSAPPATWIIGKDEHAGYIPMAPTEAAGMLARYTHLFRQGQQGILPFAPATSLAYARELSATGDHQAALHKAADAWKSDEYRMGDDANPYLARAFGETGPMSRPDFAAIAQAVCMPALIDQLTAASNKLETGDEHAGIG